MPAAGIGQRIIAKLVTIAFILGYVSDICFWTL